MKMPQTKEILKEIKKIEILTKHKVEGILQGAYHSVFKGRGIEFSEVREYMVGDDIRTIDWNVTARLNEPYVKEFIEERDLTVYVVFDISGSSFFGSEKSKKRASIELAASIMYSALKNNDNIGLALFTTKVEHFVKPRKGKKHFLKLLRDMIYFEPKNKETNLAESFRFLSNVIKKKSIIFILSDFFDKDYNKYLKVLSKKNDVVAVNVRDKRERSIPNIGYIELEDEETGETYLVNTDDKGFQENFVRLVKRKNYELKKSMQRMNIDMISLYSDEAFQVPLQRFFELRKRRMR